MSLTNATPASDGGPRADWRWLRAYYFEPCKDDLILDGIWPALRGMAADDAAAPAFFQRDWVGGPNVLIGMDRSRTTAPVEAAAADAIRRYLEAHPSHTTIASGAFQTEMAPVAKRELRLDLADAALHANNTLVVDCPAPFVPLLRDRTLAGAERLFLCRSAEIAASWLRMVRRGAEDRGAIAQQVLVALAWIASPERLTASASFYAHARGFLLHADREGKLATQFAQRYEGEPGQATRRLLQTTFAALQASGTLPLAGMPAYIGLARETLARLHDELERGTISPLPVEELQPTFTFSPDAEIAERQRRLIALMNTNTAMRAWQITVNLTYLLLNQLGIRPLQRFLACYLMARAVSDLCGLQGDRMAVDLARTGDHTLMLTCFGSTPQGAGVHP